MNEHTTAIHEAGHFVAFCRLFGEGRYGGVLTIEPTEDKVGSHAAESAEQREAFENEALYACAGYAAVLAAGYAEDAAKLGCDSDFETAARYSNQPIETVMRGAAEMMRRPENVKAVGRIADELLLRKKLDPQVVDVLIDVADGKTTEEDYQRFLALLTHGQKA